MKLILSFSLLGVLLLGSCTNSKQYQNTRLDLDGRALVRLHFETIHDTIGCCLYYDPLPLYKSAERFMVYSDSLFEFEITAIQPTVIHLIESDWTQFLVLPNDTLDVFINRKLETPLVERISFKGRTDIMSDYLSKAKLNLFLDPKKEELPEVYNARIDSLNTLALKALEDFNVKQQLPEWFVDFEKADIFCTCEGQKMRQYSFRYLAYNQLIQPRPKDVFNKGKAMQIKWLTYNAFSYLCGFRPEKYDTLLTPQAAPDVYLQYTRDNINVLKGQLSEDMMSVYVATKLLNIFRGLLKSADDQLNYADRKNRADSILVEMSPLISDTIILNFINDYKEKEFEKYLNQRKLKKGEKAPSFYLEDIRDAKVNLADFKGKLVCLNFWGTYCAPCIKSIPQKNELVQKFEKQDFVLVNILLDYDFKKWSELVKTNKFEGVHLKCKGNWSKMLKENYQIVTVPHYTLIDKDGNVLINKVNRDSLDFYVKANL